MNRTSLVFRLVNDGIPFCPENTVEQAKGAVTDIKEPRRPVAENTAQLMTGTEVECAKSRLAPSGPYSLPSLTCCERHLYSIVTLVLGVKQQFARIGREGVKWRCPECGKTWQHKCNPCGWEEIC